MKFSYDGIPVEELIHQIQIAVLDGPYPFNEKEPSIIEEQDPTYTIKLKYKKNISKGYFSWKEQWFNGYWQIPYPELGLQSSFVFGTDFRREVVKAIQRYLFKKQTTSDTFDTFKDMMGEARDPRESIEFDPDKAEFMSSGDMPMRGTYSYESFYRRELNYKQGDVYFRIVYTLDKNKKPETHSWGRKEKYDALLFRGFGGSQTHMSLANVAKRREAVDKAIERFELRNSLSKDAQDTFGNLFESKKFSYDGHSIKILEVKKDYNKFDRYTIQIGDGNDDLGPEIGVISYPKNEQVDFEEAHWLHPPMLYYNLPYHVQKEKTRELFITCLKAIRYYNLQRNLKQDTLNTFEDMFESLKTKELIPWMKNL